MELRDRLQALMDERGLSARALSLQAGLADTTVRKFITGYTRSITIENLEKIAEVLDVSLRHLMFGEPDADNVTSIWDRIPERDKPQAEAILRTFAEKKRG